MSEKINLLSETPEEELYRTKEKMMSYLMKEGLSPADPLLETTPALIADGHIPEGSVVFLLHTEPIESDEQFVKVQRELKQFETSMVKVDMLTDNESMRLIVLTPKIN